MTGPQLLIAAIIIVMVIAFIITVVLQNVTAKKIISANTMLVENQNTLLEQNKVLTKKLEERLRAGASAGMSKESQNNASQKEDEVTKLCQQTQQRREYIRQTVDMTDEELLAWIDGQMEETHLFTDTGLTLKTMAHALGLTQKRLASLFRNHPKYSSLGDYINEKRFLEGCRLLREEPNWTIEAVGAAAGFGGRRTFQTEVKRRLGITPLQYRQSVHSSLNKPPAQHPAIDEDDTDGEELHQPVDDARIGRT